MDKRDGIRQCGHHEIRGALPKSTKDPVLSYDTRHATQADLPFATTGVFHIHPNISHGAAKEDAQKGITPLVTEYQCDVITGDANKPANTFSKLQSVYNPDNSLMNNIMEKIRNLWNETQDMPLAERMDFSMSTSCHDLHMKTGSGYERTFEDCMMTFVFSWEKTDIQREFRQSEIAKLDQEAMDSMLEDVDKVISDYKATSAERYKHINNDMLMLGQCDSDSHTPLLVYVRSLAADQERNQEFIQNKKKEKETAWKSWDQSYGGGYGSQSDSSYRGYSQKR